ncbi:MAG: HAD family hydrolase [Candidatus Omnitrophota bacterium]|nr:HAD family hydrolase [Candidatus Omnitrophota bacterium]
MAKCKTQAVLFDLDNTLYDERDYFLLAFERIARHLAPLCRRDSSQLDGWMTAAFDKKGSQYPKFFKFVLEELGVYSPTLDEEVLDLYKTVAGGLTLYPDADEVLTWLRGRVKLALVTNGIAEAQANKVALLGIQPRFDHICYARAFGKEYEKPNTLPFVKTLSALEVPADRAVYVGDDPRTDISGAKRAGMVAIRIRRAAAPQPQSPDTWRADVELDTLQGLPAYLGVDGQG